MRLRFALLAGLMALAAPAAAQVSPGQVPMVIVPSCGSATLTRGSLTMTADGALCTSAGGGGAVTSNQGTPAAVGNAWPVTLAIGGALNAVGNPVFIAPGTGASFGVTGTFWQATQPVSAATLPLPSGAATSAAQATINTTLGTPFQAGGSIGNTSFGVSGTLPAFAAIPAFKIDQTTPGTTNAVQANAGTNLNTSLLALEAGGNLAQLVTDAGAPGATACATDTSSCNFNQLFQRIAQRLTTVNTTLGTPMQATGGTVGLVAGSAIVGKFGIDQTTPGTTNLVALAANQSVNVAQVNGVTPLMGNGATGTGSHRVTIASDNTAVAGVGAGATAATAPTNAALSGCVGQSAEATAVTTGQLGGVACDLTKKQIVLPYANPENFVSGTTAAMTGTTSTSLVASPGGSLRNYITEISCVNSHATVGTFVTIQDGSGGTNLATVAAAAVFGGHQKVFPTPLRQPTAATALFVANVTTGANVICSATGYKGL